MNTNIHNRLKFQLVNRKMFIVRRQHFNECINGRKNRTQTHTYININQFEIIIEIYLLEMELNMNVHIDWNF